MISSPPNASKPRAFKKAEPPPSGASFSLHALVRIVSFFQHGAPLAFIASSPMARIAAETYRAEENYRWTVEDGLVKREPGERETFDTYEARRVRRAGTRIARVITVYHDALGHVRRETAPVEVPRDATLVPSKVVGMIDESTAAAHAQSEKESLLVEEASLRSVFHTSGVEYAGLSAVSGPPLLTAALRSAEAHPSGGLLLEQPDHFSSVAFESQRGAGDPRRVFYLTGPSRRSLYVWLEDKETNVQVLRRLLEAMRWWLHRPPVSTLLYLRDTPYSPHLTPPPPPTLSVHFYGAEGSEIPHLLDCLVRPPQEAPLLEAPPAESKALVVTAVDDEASTAERTGTPPPVAPPVLDALFLTGFPSMAMHLTPEVGVALAAHHLKTLRVLKLSGVYLNDEGARLLLHAAHSHSEEEKAEAEIGAATEGGVEDLSPAPSALTVSTAALETADFSFCLHLTSFPLLPPSSCSPPVGECLLHLRSLSLHGTSIDNSALCALSRAAPKLEVVLIGSCQYVSDLRPLQYMSRLRELDAHATAVDNDGIMWDHVDESSEAPGVCFPALESLSLAGCMYLNDVTPLCQLLGLRELDLRHTPVRVGVSTLASCSRLRTLALSSDATAAAQMRLRQPELYRLDGLSCLQSLTQLHLVNLPNLESLALQRLAISRAPLVSIFLSRVPALTDLSALANVKTLQHLAVEYAEHLTNDGLVGLAQLSQLTRVVLRHCPLLSSFAPFHALPSLEHLDVRFNDRAGITTKSFEDFLHSPRDMALKVLILPQYSALDSLRPFCGLPLRVLDVRQCGVTDEGLAALFPSSAAARRGGVEAVYASNCAQLSRIQLTSYQPHLRILDLSNTKVCDDGLWSLCYATSLTTLSLENCPLLQFMHLPYNCFPSLRTLNLARNPQLNTASLKRFVTLSDESEYKYINPLYSSLAGVEELDLSGSQIEELSPLVLLKRLYRLRVASTPLTAAGVRFISDCDRLTSLDLGGVHTLGEGLSTVFSHRRLRRLDLRGALFDEGISLPRPILADCPLYELQVDHSTGQLGVLIPLLLGEEKMERVTRSHFTALPRLQILSIRAHPLDVEDLRLWVQRLKEGRRLLSIRLIDSLDGRVV